MRCTPPRSVSERRASLIDTAASETSPRSIPEPLSTVPSRVSGDRNMVPNLSNSHPKPLPTPNKPITPLPPNLLPSAPASPPTPAPSPTPLQRPANWQSADEDEDSFLLNARIHFSSLGSAQKQKFLESILSLCDSQQLSFVSSYVSPRLRKDPFQVLPTELCLRVMRQSYTFRHSPGLCADYQSFRLGTFLHRRPEDTCESLAGVEAMARTPER